MFPESNIEESEKGWDYSTEYLEDVRKYLIKRHRWSDHSETFDREKIAGQMSTIQEVMEAIEHINGEQDDVENQKR